MRDLAPIKERLADAREATRTGSPEARRKWEIVDTYAAHDLRDLIREAETCRASVAQLEGELRMVRAALASSQEEMERLQCRLAALLDHIDHLATTLAETRGLLSEVKTERDQLRAELDARDLTQIPMGGEAS